MSRDQEHLKLLGIFHFVVAGMTGVMSLLPIFHLIFGVVLAVAPAAVDAPEVTAKTTPNMR